MIKGIFVYVGGERTGSVTDNDHGRLIARPDTAIAKMLGYRAMSEAQQYRCLESMRLRPGRRAVGLRDHNREH